MEKIVPVLGFFETPLIIYTVILSFFATKASRHHYISVRQRLTLNGYVMVTIFTNIYIFFNAFSLKTFVVTVLNDVLFLNKTQTPLGFKCHTKLNLWYQNLNNPNKSTTWPKLGKI